MESGRTSGKLFRFAHAAHDLRHDHDAAAPTHIAIDTGLANSTPTSPSVIDRARRRFCSIMLPNTTPSTSGAIGTPNLRKK